MRIIPTDARCCFPPPITDRQTAESCGLRIGDVDFMRGIVSPAVQWPGEELKTEAMPEEPGVGVFAERDPTGSRVDVATLGDVGLLRCTPLPSRAHALE